MKRLVSIVLAVIVSFTAFADEFLYGGPYLQAMTDNSVYVVWITDVNTYGWVEVTEVGQKRPVKYVECKAAIPLFQRRHRVAVTGLKPGTKYEYKVYSQSGEDRSGKPFSASLNAKGEKLSFTTLDTTKKEISWLMATDIHYNKYIPNLFQDTFTEERLKECDFVMLNGDIADHFASEKSHYERLFSTITTTFASNKPYFMVRGNHETRGGAAHLYLDFHPTWTGQPYYSFRHGPVYFIVLDGGEDKPDSDIEYYGTADFDRFRREEGEWLAKVVESKDFKEAPFRVVLIHIPLTDRGWHGGRHAYKMLNPILENQDIAVAISGHTHRYSYRDLGKDNKTFPTLVFSPKQFLDIKANEKQLTIEVRTTAGDVYKKFVYDSKK